MATAVDAGVRPNDPLPLKLAFADLGQKEIPGARDNPVIVGYFRTVEHPEVKHDETANCAAAMGAWHVKAGIPLASLPPKAERLMARSYLSFGRIIIEPFRGCIVVFKRGNSSWQGHVAFYLRTVTVKGTLYVECLGANQSDAVSIARYPADHVLGYRYAKELHLPGAAAPKPSSPTPPPSNLGKAIGGAIVVTGSGGAVAAAGGVPWWAVAAGVALGLLGAGALIFFLHKRD